MSIDLHTRLSSLALAAILAAGPVWAQDATPAAPADGATTTEAPADGAAPAPAEGGDTPAEGSEPGGLSMGEPVPEQSDLGRTYIQGVSGDWEIHCIKTQLDADPCALHQVLRDEGGNSVATIEMVNLPGGQQAAAGATIVTPLETLLTEQITLSVDGGQGRRYPFSFCTQRGCVSRVGFSQADVDSFKRGNKGVMTIVPLVAPDQKVTLDISLSGFTAGLQQIAELNALNAAAIEKATAEQGNSGN